ncbi:alpha/beta hydrolase [Microbacterium sp. NEAU-LLC]|uniref:Alpha/beta hydrolase n=1 Tax=Microbacterium helvum TaxID=2773713 RepID=A0ABR8NPA8_9MICO|nr:alpha/beta hydrolase [Microbacterium helvum]MBD3942484.1 alpha/beta hydrolase [Microbacterium helvum]
MSAPLSLPRLSWGSAAAERRALLVHGLGSTGALMWRYGVALADAGWRADAVDLRGHGAAPRALDYTLAAYGSDVAAARPADGGPWDLVIGHSLGGAASVLAAAGDPAWTRRLLLIDPAIALGTDDRAGIGAGLAAAFDDPTQEAVRRAHPHWHPQDIELKALASQQTSRWAVEQTTAQNPTWDVTDAAREVAVPVDVIAAGTGSIFRDTPVEAAVAANAHFSPAVVIDGAGHSPHRDRPEATIEAVLALLR